VQTRTERDSLGEIAVPADRYWGAQTERARRNFRIGETRMSAEIIHGLALVKCAAAEVNQEAGRLAPHLAEAIRDAAREVFDGRFDDHFPLVVWQAGSGTQSNMNVNEVIANLANQRLGAALGTKSPVHPNDHVNLGQSSNDVFPTAVHVAIAQEVRDRLQPAVAALRRTLDAKAEATRNVVKLGRTHLQDAVPLTLGQEISAWSAQIDVGRAALDLASGAIHELAIGGTAVGTGLNAPPGFGARVAARLSAHTGVPFSAAGNPFAALAGAEPVVALHGAVKTLAVALHKVANDIRWLASGPRAGLGELAIPANEPGSSIMPGKVNPTQAEALTMVCGRVLGNDVTVCFGASHGQLQLNTYRPMIAASALESIRLLADATASFEEHCARGIEPNLGRLKEFVDRSLMLVTALVPHIGYDRAAEIALLAQRTGSSLREAALSLGFVSAAEFDQIVRPEAMIPRT
jgi:fumarate hydratase class II